MNKSYKVVFNRSLGCFMAVSELAKGNKKNSVGNQKTNGNIRAGKFSLNLLALSLLGFSVLSQAATVEANKGTGNQLILGNNVANDNNGDQDIAIGINTGNNVKGTIGNDKRGNLAIGLNAGNNITTYGTVALGNNVGNYNGYDWVTGVGRGLDAPNSSVSIGAADRGLSAGNYSSNWSGINIQGGNFSKGVSNINIGKDSGVYAQGGGNVNLGANAGGNQYAYTEDNDIKFIDNSNTTSLGGGLKLMEDQVLLLVQVAIGKLTQH